MLSYACANKSSSNDLFERSDHNSTYYLSVLATFKNEKTIMREWLDHYLAEGVEHFYLIDNGSTDNYDEVLKTYITRGLVTLFKDSTKHAQSQNYNKYFMPHRKESFWLMIVDLDEFVYNAKNKTIPDFLRKFESKGAVVLPWKRFGSNGLIRQPLSVVEGFTKRGNADTKASHVEIKTIVNVKFLKSLNLHKQEFEGSAVDGRGKEVLAENLMNTSEQMIRDSDLVINHYENQSWDWYRTVKMTRGDASNPESDKARQQKVFEERNLYYNEIEDTGLLEKKKLFCEVPPSCDHYK